MATSIVQRLCRMENYFVGIVAFLLGITTTFITLFYAGYRIGERSMLSRIPRGESVIVEDLLKVPVSLPTIYAITPTYSRSTQRVDLVSLCHTLMHVPELTWIVVEDAKGTTEPVTRLLERCGSVNYVHLAVKSPPPIKRGSKVVDLGRGVSQRNAGLNWIRRNCSDAAEENCRGVVYLMDDDNKYDLRLFEEIRKTKRASVFPVGFAGGLKFEGPICSENGTVEKWHVYWAPERSIPIDMAGFAINVDLILENEKAVIGRNKTGEKCRRLESCFLEQFTTKSTAECLGEKEVMVWHVKTWVDYHNDKKNPSDPSYSF